MPIKINNNNYILYMLPPNSVELQMEDGNFHTGVTDFHKKEIYIADNLTNDTKRYTIIHEITHALIDSYGFLQVEWTDEIVADFVANYLPNILDILNKMEKKNESK